MGFTLQETIGVLEFAEDHELEGATVRMSLDITRGEMRALKRAVTDEAEAGELLMQMMADALLSWDLEWKGEPVPATFDGLDLIPSRHVDLIALAWMEAITTPPKPASESGTPTTPPDSEASPTGPPTSSKQTTGANAGDNHRAPSTASRPVF